MMHKRTARRALVLALAAVMLVGPAAFGSSRTIFDPRDGGHRVDIRSASHGHRNGKLAHTVVGYKRFRTSKGPCITFDTNNRGSGEYRTCAYDNMVNLREHETKPTVDIRRPNGRTIVYIFRKRAIGSPNSYRWKVKEPGMDDKCTGCDRAPNSGWVRHRL